MIRSLIIALMQFTAAGVFAETEAELHHGIREIQQTKLGGKYLALKGAHGCEKSGDLMGVERLQRATSATKASLTS